MTLDLRGKKVVVINGKHSIGRAIAEAVAREGADVVIWLRNGDDELKEAKVLSTQKIMLCCFAMSATAAISMMFIIGLVGVSSHISLVLLVM